jgi:hypothetical protein
MLILAVYEISETYNQPVLRHDGTATNVDVSMQQIDEE